MQTNFTIAQLADPDVQHAESILRKCVHCGFCLATCPTYVLLGDELDSPRGRIYLIKDMLENAKPASEKIVKHIDRCLSCLACMSTCPSGVNYMHLVDRAREHIEKTFQRPFTDRALRALLGWILPNPRLFRVALMSAHLGRRFVSLMPNVFSNLLSFVPSHVPKRSHADEPGIKQAVGVPKHRVALLAGCAQRVLDPNINESTIRLLTRHGCEVVIPPGVGCCGALTHHMGKKLSSSTKAKANIAAWIKELEGAGLDAIVTNTSGCGTMLKDYSHIFRNDKIWSAPAGKISDRVLDISEFLTKIGISGITPSRLAVAYHSACSLQHGQRVHEDPKTLLQSCGFEVLEIPEGHLCCGSAGTYNLLQPSLANRLRDRKLANIATTAPDVIAAGNIGCITQLASGTAIPVVHTVQLLDWATGGPKPDSLATAC